MNTIIRTLPQLQSAQSDVWIYGAIVALCTLGLAVLIAFLIPWASNRRCYIKRRLWFIFIGPIASLAFWVYNSTQIAPTIQNAGFKTMYEQTNLYVLLAYIAAYYIVGVLLMFCFRHSKLGSILGKEK